MTKKWFNKGLWMSLVAVAIVAVALNGSFGQAKKVQKEIQIERLEDIENSDSEFKVKLWVDRKNATYKVGDQVVFFFKTNRDSRLTLFNVGSSGKVTILFPNEYHRDNLVKAGTTYRIPSVAAKFIFKAQGPAGNDLVKAIGTLEKVPLISAGDVKPAAGGFQAVTKAEKDLVITILHVLQPMNSRTWTEAEQVIKIVD